MVDAGHGGAEPGAIHDGRKEKDDTLNLALAVGELLTQAGFDVEYTRTTDVYKSPYERAQAANASGADLFVSIHRNSSEYPNQYNGVETLVYDESGVKAQIAENINAQLEKIGFRNIGVSERPNLVVLNSTKMPAVLVEAGFINSDKDNALFDQNFWSIAQGIADGIEEAVGPAAPEVFYRVQTGLFRNRDNAERMLNRLESLGFPSFLTYKDGLFAVQTGAFRNMENAVRMEQRLRNSGFGTLIVSE